MCKKSATPALASTGIAGISNTKIGEDTPLRERSKMNLAEVALSRSAVG